MRLKRLVSLLLAILMLASTALISVNAVSTNEASSGAYFNQGKYANQTYDGDDLGATYTPEATTWKVWSPAATAVKVKLYATGTDRENGAKVLGEYAMKKDASFASNGVWSITLDGDYKNVYYTYLVTAADTSGTVVTNETQDIYSKAVGANGDRSMVVDLASTNPEGWEDDKHVVFDDMTKTAVWEIHIRDFSCDPESGISKENQGKYLAFTEGGTTLKSDSSAETVATGIDYLVEQGINAVQLMPFADYDQVDEIVGASSTRRNWGYNPKNYNVPDGSYASDSYDGNVRINEVKQMIQALHDRGISVIMDVVYNHTAGYEASCFTKTVPGYYYRMKSAVAYNDGSGQGCELASENQMTRNFIVQSLLYWVEEYHIDGFRFDLMACIDCTTLNEARKAINNLYADGTGKKIPMYGEPWDGAGGGSACTEPAVPSNMGKLMSGIGIFAAGMRDNATNIEKPKASSWIEGSNAAAAAAVVKGILANEVSSDNTQTVNYAECHDKLTLWDKITGGDTTSGEGKASVSSNPNANSTAKEFTDRLQLAGALFATSQGITFMQMGTEFARTKQGQENSYNSSDEINQLDWSRVPTYKNVVDYYKGLNQIHEVYSPFSDDTSASENTIKFISQQGTLIAYTINNVTKNAANEWGKVAVLLNSGSAAANVNLGSSGWVVVANGTKAGVAALETVDGSSYSVAARSAAILVEKNSYKDFSDKFTFGTLTTNHYVNGEIVSTDTAKYRVGMTYHAVKDAELLNEYNVVDVDGEASGVFKGDTTVNYYYESNGKVFGNLTVQYVDANNRKLTPNMEYTIETGDTYSIPVCSIEGYQLNTAAYPANTTGLFDGQDKTITFTYKPLESAKVTVHYKRSNASWSSVLCYAYTDDGEEPLGAWDASRRNETAKMTNDGDGWFSIEIPIASCKVMFYTPNVLGAQEPGQNEPGYAVAGECWVENKIVTYSATHVLSYIDIDSGKKIAEDVVITENKRNIDTYDYTTRNHDVEGATIYAEPTNQAGFYAPGVTNIIYLYKGGKPIEEGPTEKPTVPAGKFVLGDANYDAVVNISDVTFIQEYIVKLVVFNEVNGFAADVDGNGKVNIKDASYIQRYLVGMDIKFDIGYYFEIEDMKTTEPPTQVGPELTIVKYSDSENWSAGGKTIYCYYWTEEGQAADWPGIPMDLTGDDGYGHNQYSIEVPLGCNIIFTNGESQTVDLEFTGQEGFYPTGYNAEGKAECSSW